MRPHCCFCLFALDLRDVYTSFVSISMRIFPFFHNFAIFLLLGNCNFLWLIASDNRTSCRPIQSVIILVINKSDSRCAVVPFWDHIRQLLVLESLIEYGEHGSSSFAQLPNVIPILLSLVWLQTELDSTQSYYHYKSYLWFQIELALRARSILKSRVWF